MTLFELIFFLINIALGTIAFKWLNNNYGLWLAVPGFFVGLLLIPGMYFAHRYYRKWAYLGDDFMPKCSCGSDNFRAEMVGNDFRSTCQTCRKQYTRQRDEVFIFENDQRKLYKRLVKHKGWI